MRLVGEARAGMDGEGVGIDVEEAILEVGSSSFDMRSADDRQMMMMKLMELWSIIPSTVVGRYVLCAFEPFSMRADCQDQYLQSVVSAVKDVEGLNHQFLFNLYHK